MQRVDALDTASKWLVAQVLERKIVHTPSRKDKPVELLVLLKFVDYGDRWNEWLSSDSYRIAPL